MSIVTLIELTIGLNGSIRTNQLSMRNRSIRTNQLSSNNLKYGTVMRRKAHL